MIFYGLDNRDTKRGINQLTILNLALPKNKNYYKLGSGRETDISLLPPLGGIERGKERCIIGEDGVGLR